MSPAPETDALYGECVDGLGAAEPAFVGRQVELARIANALQRDCGPVTSLLLVRGSAGIGKTSLCREMVNMARRARWRCIETRANFDAGAYAPIAAVVEDIVTRDRNILDDVGAAARATLGELTSVVAQSDSSGGSFTRHQLVGAVRQLLGAVRDAAGVAIVVDDIDVADEATVDVLVQLATRATPALLVVLAYRAERSPAALDLGVAALARRGQVMSLDLGVLPDDEAAALVLATAPTAADPVDSEAVVRLAEGNPLFLVELTRRLRVGEPVTHVAGGGHRARRRWSISPSPTLRCSVVSLLSLATSTPRRSRP